MQALLQRVSQASVTIDGQLAGEVGQGLLVLLCAEHGDTEETGKKLLEKILKLRLFADTNDKMNLSVLDIHGSLLIVSQFTLAADTSKGNRPSFTKAADPDLARTLYNAFVKQAQTSGLAIATGEFGANMQVSLINDGPVTIPVMIR